jgi:hypothetical protein
MAPPVTVQLYVLPASNGVLYATLVALAHTEFDPLTTGAGGGLMDTLYSAVVNVHEVAEIVSVNCNVPVPTPPQLTVIAFVLVPLVIVPPVMDHEKILPEATVE